MASERSSEWRGVRVCNLDAKASGADPRRRVDKRADCHRRRCRRQSSRSLPLAVCERACAIRVYKMSLRLLATFALLLIGQIGAQYAARPYKTQPSGGYLARPPSGGYAARPPPPPPAYPSPPVYEVAPPSDPRKQNAAHNQFGAMRHFSRISVARMLHKHRQQSAQSVVAEVFACRINFSAVTKSSKMSSATRTRISLSRATEPGKSATSRKQASPCRKPLPIASRRV